MARTYHCECGAGYVVEDGCPPPPHCRFCHGQRFHQESTRAATAPPPSWRRRGPLALDVFEIQRVGGRRVVFWSFALLAAFLLPREAGDDLVFSWQILLDPHVALAGKALLGLTLAGAAVGLLLGLTLAGILRGLLLILVGVAPFVLAAHQAPPQRALLLGLGVLLGAAGASLRIPRTNVARVSSLAGGLILLALLLFVYRLKGGAIWTDVPLSRSWEAALVLTGSGVLAVLAAASDRNCQRLSRISRWAAIAVVVYVTAASFGLEHSPDPLVHLGVALTWLAFFSLGTNGLADLVVAAATHTQTVAQHMARREDLGYLQRFNRNAFFGSDRQPERAQPGP